MNKTYKYLGAPEARIMGPLPAGDYTFQVTEVGEVYESKAGHLVLPVKLTIQPQGVPIFANCWTGVDKNGENRDGIAEFLICVNRAPEVGEEPNWTGIVGARGKCRLKVEIAQMGALAGKEVNKVAWFHRPKQVGPTTEGPVDKEWAEARRRSKQGANAPDEIEPDDIPF
jgi:hypothetical protein